MSIIVSESYYRQIIKIIKNIYNASYFNPYYFCLKEKKTIVHAQRKKRITTIHKYNLVVRCFDSR